MPASPTRAQLSGARDEFLLAATVQNLKMLALRLLGPPHPAGRSRGTCGAVQCLTAMQTIAAISVAKNIVGNDFTTD